MPPCGQQRRHGGGGGGDAAGGVSFGGEAECLHTFPLGSNQVHSASLAPGGLAAISASHTGELQCWCVDVASPSEVQSWTYKHLGHTEPIRALAMLGDIIVTASSDRTLRVARCAETAHGGEHGRQRRGSLFGGLGGLAGLGGSPNGSPAGARRGSVQADAGAAQAAAQAKADADRRSVEEMLRGVEDAADALNDWPALSGAA